HRDAQARRYRIAGFRRRGGAVGRPEPGGHGCPAASLRHRRDRGQERPKQRTRRRRRGARIRAGAGSGGAGRHHRSRRRFQCRLSRRPSRRPRPSAGGGRRAPPRWRRDPPSRRARAPRRGRDALKSFTPPKPTFARHATAVADDASNESDTGAALMPPRRSWTGPPKLGTLPASEMSPVARARSNNSPREVRAMNYRGFAARCLIGAAALGALTAGAAAQDEKVFKLGVVAFLSGPAAESFGKPAWDGAKTVIDALNAGTVIKPYDQVGFGGLKIEVDLIDEAGGATKQVEELRNAFERDHVDAVLGYISSGDCLAVAPAAEQLKKMLVLMDCGTPRIFEENKFKYVFRSAAH